MFNKSFKLFIILFLISISTLIYAQDQVVRGNLSVKGSTTFNGPVGVNSNAGPSYLGGTIYIGGVTNATLTTDSSGKLTQGPIFQNGAIVLPKNISYPTNWNGLIPDFTYRVQKLTTNANFTFPAPIINVTTNDETLVTTVSNSTPASPIVITISGNIHTQGVWFCTNVTKITWNHQATDWTNAISSPLW